MAVGDAFDQFEMLVRENMDSRVEDLEVRPTDVLWDIVRTMRNVTKLGRDTSSSPSARYEAKWNVLLQRGGRMTGAPFGQTELTKMGPDSAFIMGMAASGGYPDPVDTPARSWIQLKSYLRKARGSATLNRDQIEAELISDPVEDVAGGYLEDAVIQVRQLVTALGWGAGDGALGQVTDTSINVTEASPAWVEVKNGSPFRFMRGWRIVAVKTTTNKFDTPRTGNGVSARTPSYMRCTGVNPKTMKVGLQSEPGQGTIALSADDYLVYQGMWDFTQSASSATDNTPSLAPNGVDSVLIDSGTFPDTAYDVANYPELQAFIFGDDSAPELPEPEIIDEMLDYIAGVESENLPLPPMLVAERSIWTLFRHLERRAFGVQMIDQTFRAGGGSEGPAYAYADKPFMRLQSSQCRQGRIYGLAPDTYIRFMPNDLNIRWAMSQGGMAGFANIFRPVTNGRILTELSAAEYDIWWQLAQTRPNGNCVRKGVYSKRTYSS